MTAGSSLGAISNTGWPSRLPVVISLRFPVMTVLMFGYLFGGALSVPGGGSYREFLIPGIFTLTMVFEMTMAAMVTDAAGW